MACFIVLPLPVIPQQYHNTTPPPPYPQDETMSQNEVYGRYTKPVFGADVVYAAEPKQRNQQMQHMAYGLRTARLKAYVPMIEKETRNFLKNWGASVSDLDRSQIVLSCP